MNNNVNLILLTFLFLSCSKVDLPDFVDPTIEISESNFNEIIDAKNKNSDATDYGFFWLTDYLIHYYQLKGSQDTECEFGSIFGQRDSLTFGEGYLEMEANLDFNDCILNNTTSIGSVTYYLKSIDDNIREKSTKGEFTISSNESILEFTDHFYQYKYNPYMEPFQLLITEYAHISINSNTLNGSINYYTKTPNEYSSQGAKGQDIIKGANKTSIKINYLDDSIEYYLNGELRNTESY